MPENKVHVYLMPGLAAGPKIFERIRLPEHYQLHFLEWLIPQSINENLDNYVLRLSQNIKHNNPILIGVSFGGIIVQELAQIIQAKQVIIISSVKHENEFPKRLKLIQNLKAYKLVPSKTLSKIKDFKSLAFNKQTKKKAQLYNNFMQMRNSVYLDWAIYQVLHWKSKSNTLKIVHIHGDQDGVFPIKHIKNCHTLEGGTHAMIVTKTPQINSLLQRFI